MQIAILDNYDSFTYNLVQQVLTVGRIKQVEVFVFRNDQITVEELNAKRPHGLIISPGPGGPEEVGIGKDVVRALFGKIPILGVCLGHQLLAHMGGARIVRAPKAIHGEVSKIFHDSSGLYQGLESPLTVARYHSLIVDSSELEDFYIIDASTEDGIPMSIRHKTLPIWGLQFHPESFLTENGNVLIENFLAECEKYVH